MSEDKQKMEENIIKEITNSGFPLETFVSIILNKHEWIVRPSLDYYDKNIGDFRETDIIGYKPAGIEGISNILVIECKKSSEKPWVFIEQKRVGNISENLTIACFRQDFIYYDHLEPTMSSHHYSKKTICSHYFVPFTNDEQKNSKLGKAIFHAKNQVISALSHLHDQREEIYKKYRNTKSKTFFYPIIVFDGILYSAKINEDKIDLKEENHLLLSIEKELSTTREIGLSDNSTSDQEYKPYLIDIVKKECFEVYLKNFNQYYLENSKFIETSFRE